MGVILLSLHLRLHQTVLHQEELLLVLAKKTNRWYALNNRHEQEDSPDVVTSMIWVFDFIVYALLYPREILSFVTPYVSMTFEVIPNKLSEPFNISTPIGKSILAERVYFDCPVFINHKSTMTELIELDMVDFDVIICMD